MPSSCCPFNPDPETLEFAGMESPAEALAKLAEAWLNDWDEPKPGAVRPLSPLTRDDVLVKSSTCENLMAKCLAAILRDTCRSAIASRMRLPDIVGRDLLPSHLLWGP